MADYYQVLSRALRKGDFADERWRGGVYDRARQVLREQLRAQRTQTSQTEGRLRLVALEAAIERIESELRRTHPSSGLLEEERERPPLARPPGERSNKPGEKLTAAWSALRRMPLLVLAAAIAAVAAGVYTLWVSRSPPEPPPPPAKSEASASPLVSRARHRPGSTAFTNGELAPGVDGGARDAEVLYVFRRQPVFYRTTHPVGTIIVDKPQHFLYLIQPNLVALRYGIGIGSQCRDLAGLRHVAAKVEWPEWQPAPEMVARMLVPAGALAGGPGNPLGARQLKLEDGNSIHGTNAPKSIGSNVVFGCIRLVNDDIVDLYNRTSVGARVVLGD